MTLEEAIYHCKEKEDCTACGLEHKRLRLWLEDYKQLKNNPPLKLEEIKPTMCIHIKGLNINGVVLNVDNRKIEVLYVALANRETNYYDRFHEWFEFDNYIFYKASKITEDIEEEYKQLKAFYNLCFFEDVDNKEECYFHNLKEVFETYCFVDDNVLNEKAVPLKRGLQRFLQWIKKEENRFYPREVKE